jgi:UPF0176 protein
VNNLDNKLILISFYRFLAIGDKKKIKLLVESNLKATSIKGTILLADEGINGSLAGRKEEIFTLIKFIKKYLKIRKLSLKINEVDFIPFNRIKVRLKKEIVSLNVGKIDVSKFTGTYINPSQWNDIISRENIRLIDVRNQYEIKIGTFEDAINPLTSNFREFQTKFDKLNIKKSETIAMYCTGGIRCEKASAHLKLKGYTNILQLEGGILNYLEYYKKNKNKNKWKGECFVFDNRVTVKKNLKKGNFDQCYGCRNPINKYDKKSKFYIKGVSCPHCYHSRSESQKKRSHMRQSQIDNNKLEF